MCVHVTASGNDTSDIVFKVFYLIYALLMNSCPTWPEPNGFTRENIAGPTEKVALCWSCACLLFLSYSCQSWFLCVCVCVFGGWCWQMRVCFRIACLSLNVLAGTNADHANTHAHTRSLGTNCKAKCESFLQMAHLDPLPCDPGRSSPAWNSRVNMF